MTQSPPIDRVRLRGEAPAADLGPLDVVAEGDADAVVAVGAEAIERAALAGGTPILAVGDDRQGTTREALTTAAAALAEGRYRAMTHSVLHVAVDGEQLTRGVIDVTLMTREPARISEYALSAAGERLFEVRADGVVVSTPLGSAGYGRAAGGPVVEPGGGLSVVPVAPFTTRASSWVVPGPLSLHVERDEGEVSLFVDGTEYRTIAPGQPVRVAVEDEFTCLRPLPASRRELEKH